MLGRLGRRLVADGGGDAVDVGGAGRQPAERPRPDPLAVRPADQPDPHRPDPGHAVGIDREAGTCPRLGLVPHHQLVQLDLDPWPSNPAASVPSACDRCTSIPTSSPSSGGRFGSPSSTWRRSRGRPSVTRVRFTTDEVTSMCPVTGQPDFSTVEIDYEPATRCIESKSLKLYLWGFRDQPIFAEGLAAAIAAEVQRRGRAAAGHGRRHPARAGRHRHRSHRGAPVNRCVAVVSGGLDSAVLAHHLRGRRLGAAPGELRLRPAPRHRAGPRRPPGRRPRRAPRRRRPPLGRRPARRQRPHRRLRRRARRPLRRRVDARHGGRQPQRHLRPGRGGRGRGRRRRCRRPRHPRRRPLHLPRLPPAVRRGHRAPRPGGQRGVRPRALPGAGAVRGLVEGRHRRPRRRAGRAVRGDLVLLQGRRGPLRHCGTCTERREAFELAGVPDPTRYHGRRGRDVHRLQALPLLGQPRAPRPGRRPPLLATTATTTRSR